MKTFITLTALLAVASATRSSAIPVNTGASRGTRTTHDVSAHARKLVQEIRFPDEGELPDDKGYERRRMLAASTKNDRVHTRKLHQTPGIFRPSRVNNLRHE
eukprot:Blabericola_migrator_1__7020@NODE_355_length_9465_cov_113_241434_g284_i0_p8_GENE_NODE_355_length_9465_cov_113_241434_g284_i0NODE_355_length_9465_cov_113_241434_g284_i0_p8_ORF_typecomplete_len102_score23_01_NODE_355_length_9465_cov_113_241434_g284_i044694774